MSTTLRPKQRNELFKVIEEMDFDPVEFEWRNADGEWAGYDHFYTTPALVHKPTGKVFALALLPEGRPWVGVHGPWAVLSTPGEDGPRSVREYVSWADVLKEARQWLHRIREDSGPDLWALAAEQQKLLGSGEGLPNTPFSPEERTRLFATLDQLRLDIAKTQQLDAKQAAALGTIVEEGKRAAERLGRKDWIMYFLGTVTSVAISAAFAPEQARHLWQLAVVAVQWVLRAPHLLGP